MKSKLIIRAEITSKRTGKPYTVYFKSDLDLHKAQKRHGHRLKLVHRYLKVLEITGEEIREVGL